MVKCGTFVKSGTWRRSDRPCSDTRERHRQGGNVLFLDRHCEYVAAAAMTLDMWRDK